MSAQPGTIKHGFLEKMGRRNSILTSSWTTRWFVLTNQSITYYTDQSLSIKKGEVALNHTCSVTRKPSDGGSRKYLLNLHDKQSGRNLLMCASELSTLASWEQAINGVIQLLMDSKLTSSVEEEEEEVDAEEEAKRFEKMMSFSEASGAVKNNKGHRRRSNVLQEGYLYKQGYKSKSKWTKCWCVLTQSHLSYYTDSSMTVMKSILTLDKDSHVVPRKVAVPDMDHLTHGISLYLGNNRDNTTARTLCAPDEHSFFGWMAVMHRAVIQLRHQQGPYPLVVNIATCTPGFNDFVTHVEDTVYDVQLYINNRLVRSDFHFYGDLKDVNNKVRSVLTAAPSLDIPFPRTYRRSAFGVKLTEDTVEGRRFQLEHWAQELIERFYHMDCLADFGEENDVQRAVAGVFGCDVAELTGLIDAASGKLTGDEAAVAVYGEDASSASADIQRTVDMSPMAAAAAAAIALHEQEMRADAAAAALANGQATSEDTVVMPPKASHLKKFNLKKLAQLCKLQNIDVVSFTTRRQFLKALTDTYQQHVPYLHGKDARAIVAKLLATSKKGSQIDLPAAVIEIDNIFVDLLRKLKVSDSLMDSLSVEYSTQDKLSLISQCVSIWDREVDFTVEDNDMIANMATSITINSFLVLTLQYRIAQTSVANEWLNRFCDHRGVTSMMVLANRLLEQNPMSELAAGTLFHILKCFRSILEHDCRQVVVDTRGTIEMFVSAVVFSYPRLALEALELLSETIIFGGEKALYQVVNAFRLAAKEKGVKPFETIIAHLEESNVEVQSSIVSLLNSIMLYERDINERLVLRCDLNKLQFDAICTALIRKYRTGATTSPVAVNSSGTSGGQSGGGAVNEGDTGEEEEEGQEPVYTYVYRIRPGVVVCDQDMTAGYSEDGLVFTHPLAGIMEGYAIQVVEKGVTDKKSAVDESWLPVEDVIKQAEVTGRSWGRFVTDRLSITSSSRHSTVSSPSGSEKIKEEVSARRLWFRMDGGRGLVWYHSMDDVPFRSEDTGIEGDKQHVPSPPVGSLSLADVVQVLDFSSISSRLNFQLQNCFTLVVKEGSSHGALKQYHVFTEKLAIKHKWLVAINFKLNQIALARAAYRFPADSLRHTSSAAVQLRKTFEQHVTIYRSVTKEDIALMYTTAIADTIDDNSAQGASGVDPLDITRFISYELQNHKYERKLHSVLKDLASFVSERYAPKPVVAEEDEEAKGKKYPLAVPESDREVPKAPQLPYVPAAKPPKKPNAKVKQLFWTKVKPINVVNTVWMAMEEPGFPWEEVDVRFAAPTYGRKKKVVETAEENVEGDSSVAPTKKKAVPKKIALFDARRTQNIAIACGKLRKSPEEIYDMVMALDGDDLTEDVTETILNLMVPSAEEVATIKAYEGDTEDLDFCGRLFTYFLGIERLEQRLQVHRVMMSWFDFASSVKNFLTTVSLAVEELNDADCLQSLKTVMSCVLSIGNYLNGNNSRGQAHGFRLDVILKLRDVKQTGYGRRTLLHFLVEQMPLLFPDMPAFYSSWKYMWTAISVHSQNMEEMLKDLKTDVDKCAEEIEQAELIENEVVRNQLVDRLSTFITSASDTYDELSTMFDKTDAAVRAIKRYFGETVLGCSSSTGADVVSSSGSEEDPWTTFFAMLVKFAKAYQTAIVELDEWNKAEERIRNRANETAKRKESRQVRLKRAAEAASALELKLKAAESNPLQRPVSMKGNRDSRANSREGAPADVMQVFKDQMLYIRKRNAFMEVGDSSGEDDNDDSTGW